LTVIRPSTKWRYVFDIQEDCNGKEAATSPKRSSPRRQVDVAVSQDQGMTEAIRQTGVSEVTYYLAG
jgi:hypothetical protein